MDINYNVSGIIKSSPTQYLITGNIVIDDALRLWAGSSTTPAPLASPPLGSSFKYSYFITQFSLSIYSFIPSTPGDPDFANVAAYSFSGSGGSLYMERPSEGERMGNIMWYLDGVGNWTNWTGENFVFYNEDLSAWELYYDMNKLAPIIRLIELDYTVNDPIFQSWLRTEIWLTKTGPVAQDTQRISPPTGFESES